MRTRDPARFAIGPPWGVGLSFARVAIFGGVALTLLINPATVLFTTSALQPVVPVCDAYNSWAFFCLPGGSLDVVRVASGVLLLVCASGIVPWLTALPGAYLVLSFSMTTTLGDGGDQLYGILDLLLLPLSLTDWRRNSWNSFQPQHLSQLRVSIAFAGWVLIRAQIFIVYLEAAVGKLAVPEWANGTAMYYWLRSPTFGPGDVLAPLVQALTAVPLVTGLATFGTIALEFCLAIGPLFSVRGRRILLMLGLLLHGAIVILMGVSSFSIVMAGALCLHLIPMSADLSILTRKRGRSFERIPQVAR